MQMQMQHLTNINTLKIQYFYVDTSEIKPIISWLKPSYKRVKES